MNPVRAGIVSDPADYAWSSHRAHALGFNVKMWTPHPEYLSLGKTEFSRLKAYRQLFAQELGSDLISEIRNAVSAGLVLGSDKFRRQVEQLTGQRQSHLRRGPKPKKKWGQNNWGQSKNS